jgi:hypothetical protein
MMGSTKLQPKVITALLSAGVTEEMIAGAHQILGACTTRTIGRPRKYKNRAERDRAYRERRKARVETRPMVPSLKGRLVDAAHDRRSNDFLWCRNCLRWGSFIALLLFRGAHPIKRIPCFSVVPFNKSAAGG